MKRKHSDESSVPSSVAAAPPISIEEIRQRIHEHLIHFVPHVLARIMMDYVGMEHKICRIAFKFSEQKSMVRMFLNPGMDFVTLSDGFHPRSLLELRLPLDHGSVHTLKPMNPRIKPMYWPELWTMVKNDNGCCPNWENNNNETVGGFSPFAHTPFMDLDDVRGACTPDGRFTILNECGQGKWFIYDWKQDSEAHVQAGSFLIPDEIKGDIVAYACDWNRESELIVVFMDSKKQFHVTSILMTASDQPWRPEFQVVVETGYMCPFKDVMVRAWERSVHLGVLFHARLIVLLDPEGQAILETFQF